MTAQHAEPAPGEYLAEDIGHALAYRLAPGRLLNEAQAAPMGAEAATVYIDSADNVRFGHDQEPLRLKSTTVGLGKVALFNAAMLAGSDGIDEAGLRRVFGDLMGERNYSQPLDALKATVNRTAQAKIMIAKAGRYSMAGVKVVDEREGVDSQQYGANFLSRFRELMSGAAVLPDDSDKTAAGAEIEKARLASGSEVQDKYWQHRAICKDEDPELFFPTGTSGPALQQIAEAKTVCRRCPVAAKCLEWALESGQDYGVWGGMSEDERRDLKRRGNASR